MICLLFNIYGSGELRKASRRWERCFWLAGYARPIASSRPRRSTAADEPSTASNEPTTWYDGTAAVAAYASWLSCGPAHDAAAANDAAVANDAAAWIRDAASPSSDDVLAAGPDADAAAAHDHGRAEL